MWCHENQLTTLDVSNNTALEALFCSSNQLTSLDVSNNTALGYLQCSWTQISSLSVSNNQTLIDLWCNDSPLTTLDVSNNTALMNLKIHSIPSLYEVCVWTLPFPPDGVHVNTTGSPNVEFKDCSIGIEGYTQSEL